MTALDQALADIGRCGTAQVQRDYGEEAVDIGAARIIENPNRLAIVLKYWDRFDLEDERIEHLRFIVAERLRIMESLKGKWGYCDSQFKTLREAARALIEVDHAGGWEQARRARRERPVRMAAE